MTVQYRGQVEALYRRFFCDSGIDPETGTTPLQTDWKFAAYPYIGSKYGADPDVKRLLVVGRDIGSDETPGRLQHFEERRRAIECTPLPSLNPHIAGTYFTVLKYACPGQEWDQIKDRDQTCQAILRDGYSLRSNPLSYIALTNFYKWVTVGRRNKGGAQDCTFVDPQLERGLFLEEVRLLAPHVVVFQGADFDKARFRQVRDAIPSEAEWHVLVHPSLRGSRRPKDITHPRLSGTDPNDDSLPPSPAVADDLRTGGTEGYGGLFRDDALLLGLIALDGQNQAVRLHDVVAHVLEHGYAGPRGGKDSAIYFACRWLAKHGKPVRGFVITSPRRGYYRLEKATKARIAAWSTDVA
ncbi:hypothetical protein [Candidatus Palauibacter sp.]|uniref:hypothetical protein n=1 Tax=Candidatus Palauibacter sp. TaxID=3101350 RepID=UPI003B529260